MGSRQARSVILDTNILIEAVREPGGDVADWIADPHGKTQYRINLVIFAEIAINFADASDALHFIAAVPATIEALGPEECFRAGMAHVDYRRRGGRRETILPDFLIGAQAAERGWPLVTRDRKGFASYFPELEIIDPTVNPA